VNASCNNSKSSLSRFESHRFSTTRVLSFTFAGLLVWAALIVLPSAAWADTVILKNGDHLTGTVTQLADGKLTLTTAYAGAVIITWDEVTNVKLDKPLVMSVETRHGRQVDIKKTDISGIERTTSGFVVATVAGPQPVPPQELTTLRNAAAQQAYEASIRPNFLHGWIGAANVSIAVTSGNSENTSVGTGVNLSRPTRTDKTTLYFNTVYSHDNVQGITTADSTNAGLRYDHNVNPKLFGFGTLDFATDGLQDLDLRTVAGGGFGWHAVAKPNRQLDVLGGIVWTHEDYSSVPPVAPSTTPTPAETNSFAALDFGEQYTQKFGKATVFTEQAYIFPNLQDTSQFRATVNSALSTRINNFLSWQTSFSDIYVTNPPAGTKDNDVVLTTGLGFTFTKK
jgi:putative salt-induced outer membrane protein